MAHKHFLFFVFAGALSAQTEYFPLHVGNQWVYRGGGGVRVVDIPRSEQINGKEYAVVRNWFESSPWFTREVLLRMAENGTLYALDRESGREAQWVAFGTPEGGSFETELDPCNKRGVVTSKGKFSSPVGEFVETFQAGYPAANCADAGLDSEVYGKWIGLLRRRTVTIAGPRDYDLIYARIGGVTVLSERELSFGITIDKAIYTVAPMTLRLTLRHSQPEPIVVEAPSHLYDFEVRNEKGDPVFRWSAGKVFPAVIIRETFAAGERNWADTYDLKGGNGLPLPPGKYTIEGWLTTTPKVGSASVAFEVR